MDAKEILNIIKSVENSTNKDNELKKLKINKSTYYNWLRKYNNGGLNALDAKKKKWTSYEVNLLLEKVKTHEYIIDIQKYLPNRTCASISVKLMELGVSIEEIRREKKLKRTTKICKQCNSEKKLSEYYKIGQGQRGIDGLRPECKECTDNKQSKYRKDNIELIKKRNISYRNRIKIDHPTKTRDQNRKWRATARGTYTGIKQRCDLGSRGHKLIIAFEEFEKWFISQPLNCYYCEISLDDYLLIQSNLKGNSKRANRLTVDRKDSKKDYSLDNIVLACHQCNDLKGFIFESEEFKEIAKKYIRPILNSYL